MKKTVFIILFGLLAQNVFADGLLEFMECKKTQNDQERLKCYDVMAEKLTASFNSPENINNAPSIKNKKVKTDQNVSQLDGEKIKRGEVLTKKFVKQKDATILIFGGATDDPRLELIFTNLSRWTALKQGDKESVCLYMKSIIGKAKANPAPYINMSSGAPIYQRIVNNAKNMCDDCWGVSSTDATLVMGDEAWSRAEFNENSKKFSEFSAGKHGSTGQRDTRGKNRISKEDVLDKRTKMYTGKMSKEVYYNRLFRSVSADINTLTLIASPAWLSLKPAEKSESVKRAFTLWLNIGGMLLSERENPGDYTIIIRSIVDNRKLATWDELKGFKEIK